MISIHERPIHFHCMIYHNEINDLPRMLVFYNVNNGGLLVFCNVNNGGCSERCSVRCYRRALSLNKIIFNSINEILKSIFIENKDTFAILQTGHGKSLPYQIAPLIAQKLSGLGHHHDEFFRFRDRNIVIIISGKIYRCCCYYSLLSSRRNRCKRRNFARKISTCFWRP